MYFKQELVQLLRNKKIMNDFHKILKKIAETFMSHPGNCRGVL